MDHRARLRRNIKLAYALEFLTSFSFGVPIVTIFMRSLTASVFEVSVLLVLTTVLMAVLEVPTGVLADLFKRRNTLILGAAFGLASVLVLATAQGFAHLAVFAVLAAVSRALYSGTLESLVYDSLKELGDDRSYKRIFGRVRTIGPAAMSVASLIGGALAATSLRLPIIWTVPVFALAVLVAALFTEPSVPSHVTSPLAHSRQAWSLIGKNRELLLLLGIALLLNAFGESLHQVSQLFYQLKHIPVAFFGVLMATVFAFSSLGSLVSHRVADAMGDRGALVAATILSIVTILAATLTSGFVAGLLLALASIGYGIRGPILSHLINSEVSSAHRTTILSINNLAASAGFSLFALVLGYTADTRGLVFGFQLFAAMHIIIIALQMRLKPHPQAELSAV